MMAIHLTRSLIALILAVLVVVPVTAQENAADETPVQAIALSGSLAEPDAEISSLAWYGDQLVLMTENPFEFRGEADAGKFFALSKEDILAYLDSDRPDPLEPVEVPIISPDIEDTVGGFEVQFDGFEAIVFVPSSSYFANDLVFLTIEAETADEDDPSMRGYIVWGTVEDNLHAIHLNLSDPVRLPTQTDFPNMSYESLLVSGNTLVALYEVNGTQANPDNVAVLVDLTSGETTEIPMADLNFRVTDATLPDESGLFWVINYFFPGEEFLAVDSDPLFEQYGTGASQAEFGGYERLVALRYTDTGIELAGMPPVQLQQTEESSGRNWEGIAPLDDRGFLVVTDRYPETILAFVPANTGG